jgi:protein TonB
MFVGESLDTGFASLDRMNASLSRGGLLALVVGLHLAFLWLAISFANRTHIDLPVPYPVVMVEMLHEQQPAKPQVAPEPEPPKPLPPKPMRKPEPAPPKPVVRERPAPAPAPTPAPAAPSERAPTPQATAPAAPPPAAPSAAESAPAQPAPISAPRFDAAYLSNPLPPYPRTSKRLGEQGRVMLRVHVTPEGAPDEVRVQTSSGSSALDESARDTVRSKWKFVPAKQGGTPVAAWVNVPIDFKLNSD